MTENGIHETRIKALNDREFRAGEYVLYWMQQSQRAEFNHALEYAILQSNRLAQPVLVVFGLTANYPEANLRHYTFMLEGLRETQQTLSRRGIRMIVRLGSPQLVALELGRKASLIVCDRGYLRHQKTWRKTLSDEAACAVVQVESDTVIPVEEVSTRAEYAARTIRPKIHRKVGAYLVPVEPQRVNHPSSSLDFRGEDLSHLQRILRKVQANPEVGPVSRFFGGGTEEAKKRFRAFLDNRLKNYSDHRNQPQTDDFSGVSPYLHFGQVSPLYLALEAQKRLDQARRGIETFLEELLVRRELSINHTEYTTDYDEYSCIPSWSARTLEKHRRDVRPHQYTPEQLENAESHDPYWNASMLEMRHTGFMHNYMRMYWGKRILEWSARPEEAFAVTLSLNNKYFLDGRDPNSYAGVGWIFGLHDRPWKERPIFGTVRCMTAAGLERKCDIKGYVEKIDRLVER